MTVPESYLEALVAADAHTARCPHCKVPSLRRKWAGCAQGSELARTLDAAWFGTAPTGGGGR